LNIRISSNQLLIGVALFVAAFANRTFFGNVAATFGESPAATLHTVSLAVVLICALALLFSLLSIGRTTKPILTLFLLLSSVAAYFMDSYNVIIDRDMLVNAVNTNSAEAGDLLTARLLLYITLLGVLPSVFVWRIDVHAQGLAAELRSRALLAIGTVALAAALIFASSAFYASFIREHKSLRYYTNPITPIYSMTRFAAKQLAAPTRPLEALARDARTPVGDANRELVIMVVGETARADRFSLNGYSRLTNPKLAAEGVISFSQMSSCGTSTAISVPCIFSHSTRGAFDGDRARSTENLLDILQRAGVDVLWRDNNSDSKGVATRVPFENFRSPGLNPLCNPECRDEGMLHRLQDHIDRHAGSDILIVLHQMGSHGPAYHKRYPPEFRHFAPTCETSQLDTCTQEEISNTYDNTILYTDHFLSEVIRLLRANDQQFETSLFYLSDHGESLGEAGLYLHGLPYVLAPDTQTKVPFVLWFGSANHDIDVGSVQRLRDEPTSHDNVFHTLLGLFEVRSEIYDSSMDLLQRAHLPDRVETNRLSHP
jgi:lipid A ethanolaminephosphotransferase